MWYTEIKELVHEIMVASKSEICSAGKKTGKLRQSLYVAVWRQNSFFKKP